MFTLITFGLVGYIVTLDTMKSYNMSLKLILFKLGNIFYINIATSIFQI